MPIAKSQSFDRAKLEAQQRERVLQREHEYYLAERHRADRVQLATMLHYKVLNATREELLEALGNPDGVRLASIPYEPARSGSPYERTFGGDDRYVFIPRGEEPPEHAGEVIPLEEIADGFFQQRARARRNSGCVDMPGASPAVVEREKKRLEEALVERVKEIEEDLPAITMGEIEHLRLSEGERALIERTLKSGSEREQQELMLIRRPVTGPGGDLEFAVGLHRWTPEVGRPARESLGAGGKVLNLAELRDAARDRAVAREKYGNAALEEFPGYREPVI